MQAAKTSFPHRLEYTPWLPLKCMIAILLHGLFVYLLQPPLLYRVYYFRFLAALLAGLLWVAREQAL